MTQLLIGLAGLDTKAAAQVAAMLEHAHGFFVVRIAEPFEEALAAITGHPVDHVRDPAHRHTPALHTLAASGRPHDTIPTLGSALRDLRCDFAHMQHREFIPNHLEHRLQVLVERIADHPGIVIPDLLFSNEGDFVRSHGGTVVHIQSDTAECRASWGHYGTIPVQRHANDATLISHGTVIDLQISLQMLLDHLRQPASERSQA